MKKIHLISISIAGGLLLSLAWPERGFSPLLFIGFIPFLFIEDYIFDHQDKFRKRSVFLYTYPGFLLWNILTTWWIWNSTDFGAIMAWALNALFMAAIFWIFHSTRRAMPGKQGQIPLIFFWIAFEYFHHNWDGTWPWLSLGNGFAGWHKWIQWYEYTGIFGGTLWILAVNILAYDIFKGKGNREKGNGNWTMDTGQWKMNWVKGSALVLLIVVPVLLSYRLYNKYEEKPWPVDVIVVQPDIDPYNEQYTLESTELLKANLELAQKMMDDRVDFIASPESALQENIWENRLHDARGLASIREYLKGYPSAAYIIGASTFYRFGDDEKKSATARKFRSAEGYYDAFNTAFYIDTNKRYQLHHKSKLTPGVEKMPLAVLLKPLESLALDLGGTVGSLGTDKERTVFLRKSDSLKIAPVICYESVFGEYVTQYIRKGANLIFVITNDGWWGNTPGHRQHLTFSKLRAIETRRSIARSANTGISAFIGQRGDIYQRTNYWEPAVIRQEINANNFTTFYVRYGDYIARLSAFIAVFVLLISISTRLRKKVEA